MPYVHRSNSQPRPRNRPAVAAAVHALERLTPAILEQANNALSVNGYEVLVYNRLRTGVQCSCSGGGVGAKANGAVLNSAGEASQETLQELLIGGAFGYVPYGNDNRFAQKPHSNIVTKELDELADRQEAADGATEFDSDGYLNATGRDSEETDPDVDFPLNPFAEGHLISCPICFGTGYVGGYSVTNSWRFVTSSVFPLEMEGAEIDINRKPNQIVMYQPGTTVMFEARLPAGALTVDAMNVYDGVHPLTSEARLEYKAGGTWHQLTKKLLLDQCDGAVHQLRVYCLKADQRMTHVELQLGVSKVALLVEWPKIVETADTSILEAIQDVQLVCSPLIPQLRPFDIMADMNNRRLWMMREATRFDNNARARGKVNYGYDASARVIQRNEIWSILPVRYSSVADSRARSFGWGASLVPPR